MEWKRNLARVIKILVLDGEISSLKKIAFREVWQTLLYRARELFFVVEASLWSNDAWDIGSIDSDVSSLSRPSLKYTNNNYREKFLIRIPDWFAWNFCRLNKRIPIYNLPRNCRDARRIWIKSKIPFKKDPLESERVEIRLKVKLWRTRFLPRSNFSKRTEERRDEEEKGRTTKIWYGHRVIKGFVNDRISRSIFSVLFPIWIDHPLRTFDKLLNPLLTRMTDPLTHHLDSNTRRKYLFTVDTF